MKEIVREASVLWKGGKKHPTARVSTGGGVFKPADFPLGLAREPRTDAAELIGTAHAMSFSAELAHELRLKLDPQGRIVITVRTTLARTAAGWTISNIHLNVVARLPGVTQGRFIDAAIRAKTRCIISRSLRANVAMNAKLED